MKSNNKICINLNPVILIILSFSFVSACSSKSDDKKDPAATQNEFLSSYEAVDTCTTDRQVFKAGSEEEIANSVCSALVDENLNKQCATEMRAELFRSVSCKGIFPVRVGTSLSSTSTFNKSYAYQEDKCSTGIHFFYAASTATI